MEVILKPHHRQVLLGISQTESHSHKAPAEKLATQLCVCQKIEAMGLAHGREINLNHRITESVELEDTHKDYQVQILALQRTPPESHQVLRVLFKHFLSSVRICGSLP